MRVRDIVRISFGRLIESGALPHYARPERSGPSIGGDGRRDREKLSRPFVPTLGLYADLVAWRGGFGDFGVINTLSTQHTLYFDNNENKLVVNEVKIAKDGPVSVSGRFLFAGLEDTYFTAVALPTPGTSFEVQTWNDSVAFTRDGATKDEPHIGVALGGDGINTARLYIGPKDVHTLRAIDPKLEQVVDWGWFGLIARPLFASLNWFNDHYIHNYGWSIVVVTILINFLLLPLKVSNVKSMKKMAALQPQVKQIQDKYSNLPMRDPRRQQQQAEMMDLYKQHGVNPLGGCVPMLLQMPFLFAFYKVLTVAIEMRGAQWLWVGDLSQPEQLSLRILPLATIATQFLIQKMTPQQPGADPQQQRIMMLMPLMFIFIFWSVASGLVLYWLTGNLVGIAHGERVNDPVPLERGELLRQPRKALGLTGEADGLQRKRGPVEVAP